MARRMKDDDNLEEIKAAFKGQFKVKLCYNYNPLLQSSFALTNVFVCCIYQPRWFCVMVFDCDGSVF